jgi:hypothetical protein
MTKLSLRVSKGSQVSDAVVDSKSGISAVTGTYRTCDSIFDIGFIECGE